jgi:hypothetical protein
MSVDIAAIKAWQARCDAIESGEHRRKEKE